MDAVENLDDLARGVKALEVAVGALSMIAALEGVQGQWALTALRDVKAIMVPERHLRAVDIPDDPTARLEAAWDTRR